MTNIVLIRHGQSAWNKENRFTGWVDVDLSEQGIAEARAAGQQLRAKKFKFDVAYTSLLKRAVRTLWLVMEELDQMYLPVKTDWRMNERHYGALQGLDKKETTEKHGAEQVQKWRRGYAVRPPALDEQNPDHPKHDPRYAALTNPPATESLADTLERVVPFWQEQIVPDLKAGKHPIIVAHGNSLRALRKHLENISDEEIVELNIPTGFPMVYEFDSNLKVTRQYYLGDQSALDAAVDAVSRQSATK